MCTAYGLAVAVPDLDPHRLQVGLRLFYEFLVCAREVFLCDPLIGRKSVVALMLVHQLSPAFRLYAIPRAVAEILETALGASMRPEVEGVRHAVDNDNRRNMVDVDVEDVAPVQRLPAVLVSNNGMYLAGIEPRSLQACRDGVVEVAARGSFAVAVFHRRSDPANKRRVGGDTLPVQFLCHFGSDKTRLLKLVRGRS